MDRVLSNLRSERKYLSWAEYSKIAELFNVTEEPELVKMTQFLTDVGTLVWCNQVRQAQASSSHDLCN